MIINKILIVGITIILIMSSIFIGGPLKSNIEIINSIISIIAILYIIWKTKKEKRKLINNKIDIFVILFMLSSCIPLIFGTYISLESTILSIYQSISITAMYFLVKQLKQETNNKYSFIEIAILLSGIIVFIIGIDNLTSNVFIKKLHEIGILYFVNDEDRMIANLGYANSTAIIFAISSFIAIGLNLKKEKDLPKIFYGLVTFCYIVGIGLTKSKATILCFFVIFIVYVFLLKNKKKRIEAILNILITIIIAIAYIVFFEKIRTTENYLGLWIATPLFALINGLIWMINSTISKKIQNINKKQIIIVFSTFILLVIVGFIYGLKQAKELVLFTSATGEKEFVHYIYNVEGNKKCNVIFDIESYTTKENGYKIIIEEENVYDLKVSTHLVEFDNFEGEKKFNFTTNEDTKKLKIKFIRTEKENNAILKINSLNFNGKEIALKYKYLPTSLVNILKNTNIKNKGAWERGVFILDGIKIAKNNFLFGAGGDAWRYLYGTVQSYAYVSPQSHCFYTQIIIENGVVGLISFLGIIICIAVYSIKYLKQNRDEKYMLILFALRNCMFTYCNRF